MLTVVCVLSTSDGRRTYDASHVERLRGMVAANLTGSHRFVCLTNEDVACERMPLVTDWVGWWSKIEIFRPGLFDGRVLYLDLDVTIVGPIDDIAHYPPPFASIKDWLKPTINSSVMAWDAGVADHVFTDLTDADIERLHGDQDWISERMPDAEMFPVRWCVSYRKKVRTFGAVPGGAKIVVFHGLPKPWEVAEVA